MQLCTAQNYNATTTSKRCISVSAYLRYYRANPVEDIFHATFRMAKAGEEGARLLTAAEIYTEMRRVHGVALRDVSCTAFARILPELGERVHTKYCNGYWVVRV